MDDQPDDREEVRRLRSLLARYDEDEVAAVEARVRAACITARPEDAEATSLAIVLDVLRFRHRGLDDEVLLHDQSFPPPYRSASRAGDDDA